MKLLVIKFMVGLGFVHLPKHDPHIEMERYRRKPHVAYITHVI